MIAGKTTKILIIDDDLLIREMLGDVLDLHGYAVEVADSAVQGLQKALRFRPDLIVLDLCMPGMDGFKFLEKFNSEIAPVLVMTALGSKENLLESARLGAIGFFSKEFFHTKDFLKKIEESIQKWSSRHQVGLNSSVEFESLTMSKIYKEIERVSQTEGFNHSARALEYFVNRIIKPKSVDPRDWSKFYQGASGDWKDSFQLLLFNLCETQQKLSLSSAWQQLGKIESSYMGVLASAIHLFVESY